MKPKENDIVTLEMGSQNPPSNTFRVVRKLENESVLSHPLAPECLIIRKDEDLNKTLGTSKSTHQKCLEWLKKNKSYLKYWDVCEIQALCAFYVVYRMTTPDHRQRLSLLCEKTARIYCQNSMSVAYKILRENKAILIGDEFNSTYYRSHEGFILGVDPKPMTERNISCIYRMVGFALAQVEDYEENK